MGTLIRFLDMGGYAFYVWSAYAVAFAVLLANFLFPAMRVRRLRRAIARRARAARRRSS